MGAICWFQTSWQASSAHIKALPAMLSLLECVSNTDKHLATGSSTGCSNRSAATGKALLEPAEECTEPLSGWILYSLQTGLIFSCGKKPAMKIPIAGLLNAKWCKNKQGNCIKKERGGGGGKQNKNPQNNPQFLFGYGVFFRVFSPAVALKL